MILSTQILSLIYSFFYGIFFFSMLEVNYKILYNGKFIEKLYSVDNCGSRNLCHVYKIICE